MSLQQLGNISTTEFLQTYWQQRPVYLPDFFPDLPLISPERLFENACQTDASRLVGEQGLTQDASQSEEWAVEYGPFSPKRFAQLPDTPWSLLVNDCETLNPELQSVKTAFDFIPHWRQDDIMVSLANDAGSVGPHWDSYDVFLIQALGQREWQIGEILHEDPVVLPDKELRIMAEFTPSQNYLLGPGDALYLPPMIPHFGRAVGQCMTYSMGFRSPSANMLLEGVLHAWEEDASKNRPFSDPKRTISHTPEKINREDLEALADYLMAEFQDRESVIQAIQALLTEE